MFILKKILFSRPLDSQFLLPAVSCPHTENTGSSCAWEAGGDNYPVLGESKGVLYLIYKSKSLICYSVQLWRKADWLHMMRVRMMQGGANWLKYSVMMLMEDLVELCQGVWAWHKRMHSPGVNGELKSSEQPANLGLSGISGHRYVCMCHVKFADIAAVWRQTDRQKCHYVLRASAGCAWKCGNLQKAGASSTEDWWKWSVNSRWCVVIIVEIRINYHWNENKALRDANTVHWL